MFIGLDERDRTALTRSAELLEATGRTSTQSTVALNSLAAADLLSQVGIGERTPSDLPTSDGQNLGEVLILFGDLSEDALQSDPVLDALHHVLVARLAAR